MEMVPAEIFGVLDFFYRKFVKKSSEVGDPKNRHFGFFSIIDLQNFCQLGKNVFFELQIFFKSRISELFLNVRLQTFFTKTDSCRASPVKKMTAIGRYAYS